MRVLTRVVVAALTAGALIAPATTEAARAATPVALVTHQGGTYTPTPAPIVGPQALQGGQQLAIHNLSLSAVEYTITASRPLGPPSFTVVVPGGSVRTMTVPLAVSHRIDSESKFTLDPEGSNNTFVAL